MGLFALPIWGLYYVCGHSHIVSLIVGTFIELWLAATLSILTKIKQKDTKAEFVIVNGNGNRDLAIAIARLLDVEVANCRVERFPDTEVNVHVDEPVRERRVFIVQSSCFPVDQRVMEVLPSPMHYAVIRVFDEAGNIIETYEQAGEFKITG
jgi:hypothetical protein